MEVVRRIFRMIAEGSSVNGTRTALEIAKVRPPRGAVWQRNLIRECIFDFVYKPHSYKEAGPSGTMRNARRPGDASGSSPVASSAVPSAAEHSWP